MLVRPPRPDDRGDTVRRGVRAVEGARLESVYTVKSRIEGSNPSLSATLDAAPVHGARYGRSRDAREGENPRGSTRMQEHPRTPQAAPSAGREGRGTGRTAQSLLLRHVGCGTGTWRAMRSIARRREGENPRGSTRMQIVSNEVHGGPVGPPATIVCELRQARKGATAANGSGAGMRLAGPPPSQPCLVPRAPGCAGHVGLPVYPSRSVPLDQDVNPAQRHACTLAGFILGRVPAAAYPCCAPHGRRNPGSGTAPEASRRFV